MFTWLSLQFQRFPKLEAITITSLIFIAYINEILYILQPGFALQRREIRFTISYIAESRDNFITRRNL